jgi:RNA polymerase sigma-70 factor, ECF subfamily
VTTGLSVDAGGSTSHTLLERVRRQDPEAWRRFATLYTPLVVRWCAAGGLRSHDAADVTQEVFQAVFHGIGGFERHGAGESLRGWLWTITRNKICDHFRRRKGEPVAVGGTANIDRAASDSAIGLTENEPEPAESVRRELVHRALALLETDFEATTWQAFWATTIDGLPAKTVAEKLGMTPAAVYTAKSRVLSRLRRELEGLWE